MVTIVQEMIKIRHGTDISSKLTIIDAVLFLINMKLSKMLGSHTLSLFSSSQRPYHKCIILGYQFWRNVYKQQKRLFFNIFRIGSFRP